tara:strand:+ start:251 stop:1657 length:1407 start_codon:yes stop_codon:yes gene_type:complete
MSEIKVNKLTPRTNCGTVTLGDSGDSFTIPAGVTITNNGTQSGFGREGSVDWQTASIKTSTFTAVSGEGYFVDTSSGGVTVNLPAGSAGAIVAFADYTRTFSSNNLTISPNGSNKIGGIAQDAVLNADGQSATLVFVDATEGWINVQETQTSITGTPPFIVATGGTESTSGDFKIHTFTGPGTFQITNAGASPNNVVDYLVVAGGGGGTGVAGSGAGAGGFRLSNDTCMPSPQTSPLANATGITSSVASFPITVGAGGTAPNPAAASAPDGSPSIFSTITSAGGGGSVAANNDGRSGGSGSGGGGENSPGPSTAGAGNTPSTNPAQGTPGGTGGEAPAARGAGGGGGAACAGSNGSGSGGAGGAGSFVVGTGFAGCNGEAGPVCGARYFAGGGGGGFEAAGGSNGVGGVGGGGDAGPGPGGSPGNGQAGVANTGGGGGGGSRGTPGTNSGQLGGNGGSGIVILRYKFQ